MQNSKEKQRVMDSLRKLVYSRVNGNLVITAEPLTKDERKAAMDAAATSAGYVKAYKNRGGDTWLSAECFEGAGGAAALAWLRGERKEEDNMQDQTDEIPYGIPRRRLVCRWVDGKCTPVDEPAKPRRKEKEGT